METKQNEPHVCECILYRNRVFNSINNHLQVYDVPFQFKLPEFLFFFLSQSAPSL